MGTNYYVVNNIDSSKLKKEISDIIDSYDINKDFNEVSYEIKCLLTHISPLIHIGKSSYGWKFLFNHNNEKYYDKTRKSIDKFIRKNKIVDEYGKNIEADEFWELVDSKKNLMDNKEYYSYHENPTRYIIFNGYCESYHDGLRFSDSVDFS